MIDTGGQRLIASRYRLTAPIGSGGVGVVWRARDVLLDREVAVKEIVRFAAGGRDASDDTYQRVLGEARAAARITHPGVAAVYDVFFEAGAPYIVMQLIEGRPLAQILKENGPLAVPRAADIGRQLLDALTAGHAVGVLHRDLKPANVLVTASCRAVLTDFGIASVAGSPSLTQAGVVLGTPSYLPPERAQGQAAGPASDMWSLGATLFAAVNGDGPYDGYDGTAAALAAIISQDPPEPPVGGPLSGIIRALMDRDPGRRPSTAETALALERAAGAVAGNEPASSAAPVRPARLAAAPPHLRTPVTARRLPEDQLVTAPVIALPSGGAPRQGPGPRSVSSGPLEGPVVVRGDRPRRGRPRLSRRGRPRRTIVAAAAAAVTAGALLAALTSPHHIALTSLHHPARPAGALAGSSSPVPAVREGFRVTAAVNADGGPELFARARDGYLMADRFGNGLWSGWTSLPGGHIYTGVPAVAGSRDGPLVVVARTASGMLAYLWQPGPGSRSWDGPVALGSRLTSSDPAVLALPDGRLEVFARLGNDALGAVSQVGAATGIRWSGWSSMGGDLAGPPVAALNSDGDPEVFAVGADGSLVDDYSDDGSWRGWDALPGGRMFTGVPSVGTNFDGRLEVFARTSSGAIEHVWQLPSDRDRWGGAHVLMNGIISDPAVYSTVGGRIEAFAATPDGSVLHTWQDKVEDGTPWSNPASIGGSSASVPVPVRVGRQSEVFVRMPGGAIASDRQTASLTWLGWSDLGGSF